MPCETILNIVSAPSHPVDVDDDGVKELFEYDVAVLADDDEIREAFGGLQIRDGNKLNSIAILDGGSGCDYDFNRPVLEMVGTSTTSQHGNRGEVELFEASVRVSPVSVGSGVNNALAWTLHFTETLPPPPTATTVMAVVGDDVNLSYTHTFTEPIPPPNNGFISSDLCPVIPGPD